MPIRSAFIVLVIAVAALSGCGRRGDLQLPHAGATATQEETPSTPTAVSPLDPGSGQHDDTTSKHAIPPKKHFFLDFLL